MAVASAERYVRSDGIEKVTGQSRYTADMSLSGMLHGEFVLAGIASARIKALDTTKAAAVPGVLAIITQDDVPDLHYGGGIDDRTLFASGVVRFEGEVVAAVAALSAEAAREAASLIRVEYEPLTPVLDVQAALEEGSPLVHKGWEDYDANPKLTRNGNDCSYVTIEKGDVGAGFAEADEILRERYVADQSHPVPMEPHGVLAEWEGEKLTIWSSTQVPFGARAATAHALQLPESAVRVVVPTLGGGFGGKCEFLYEAHVAALARKVARPVRVILDRRAEFIATDMARHAIVMDLETGVRSDGTITARKAELWLDTGAYAAHGPGATEIATMMAVGPYRIPNLLIEAHTVYTNRTPAGSTRAPTGPQVCWAVEQHTDLLAERVETDAIEFRLQNLAKDGDEGPTCQILEGCGVKECVEKAAELIGWGADVGEHEGLGLACGWWFSYPSTAGAYVTLNTDGSATIVTGAQENGSGAVMGLALLAADELGLEPDQISFHYQDTQTGLWDMGSCGSQTTFNAGRAVVAAAGDVRERLLQLAADELEAAPTDLELAEGEVRAKDAPDRSVSIAKLARKANRDGQLILGRGSPPKPAMPENAGASCSGRSTFPAFAAPAFFCQAARVRVDPRTGRVQVGEMAAVHDYGRILNPVGAEGQVEGGIAQSLGTALTEGTVVDGGLQANPHLLDYKLQTAADVPPIAIAFVESTVTDGGPRGSKGVGEPPVVPTAGAVANAIANAAGTRVYKLPMTPPRVWEAIEEGAG